MVETSQVILTAENARMELVSPASINEVFELKENIEDLDPIKEHWDESKDRIEQLEVLERFVCITDIEQKVKFSNSKNLKRQKNIFEQLNLKSKTVEEILSELLKKEMPENSTLLNGHICFISLNHQQKVPVLLKLQIMINEDKNHLLIWSFKKASIIPVTDSNGFKIDEDDQMYKFKKFKFVLAVNQSGKLISVPNEILKYIFGKELLCNPRRIEEILSDTDDLKLALNSACDETDHYQKLSVSSLDLAVDESYNLKPIFSTKSRLKSLSEMIVSVNLYSSIHSRDNEAIFPIQLKYQDHSIEQESQEFVSSNGFPDFPGFKVIRKVSESINSSVYEAIKLFQANNRVIVKQIHSNSQTVKNELKFYEFFSKDEIGCEFIEKPIKIDLEPYPTVYMKSKDNQMDLFDYISSKPYLANEEIQRILFQIAKAVEYLHDNRIIHRDIKDENILIDTTSMSVKMIDFGSSAFLDDSGPNFSEYVGTVSYAPVEVLKGQPFDGPAQDIWCLGILLYVLCFKEPPFHSPKEILQGYLRLPIERPSNCIQLIRQMLDPKPENRPNIQTILQDEFLKL